MRHKAFMSHKAFISKAGDGPSRSKTASVSTGAAKDVHQVLACSRLRHSRDAFDLGYIAALSAAIGVL